MTGMMSFFVRFPLSIDLVLLRIGDVPEMIPEMAALGPLLSLRWCCIREFLSPKSFFNFHNSHQCFFRLGFAHNPRKIVSLVESVLLGPVRSSDQMRTLHQDLVCTSVLHRSRYEHVRGLR